MLFVLAGCEHSSIKTTTILKSTEIYSHNVAHIAFFETKKEDEQFFTSKLKSHNISFFPSPLTSATISKIKKSSVLVIFIYSKITDSVLEKLPNLKLICTMSTGFDHIDLNACKKRKVTVCNVPHYGENTVAEHTMALLLAISRKIPQSTARTHDGNFSLSNLQGFDLKQKTIGIVGAGSIGQHVISYAKAFGMNVLVYDIHQNKKLATKLGFKYVSLKQLFQSSDIVSFHLPYSKSTHHILNLKNISQLKKGSIIINTARGGVIETAALLKGLNTGIISFAGLDVLEEECFIKEEHQLLSKKFASTCNLQTVLQDHMLLKHPNVFITPHNAFNSAEAIQRIRETAFQNIKSYFSGKKLNKL